MILLPILLLMISIKLFGKMRIESLKLLCYSVKSPSSDGLATQLIAFFPNFTSSSSLIETLPANDDSLPLNYNSTRPHVRTYKFKKKVIILVLKVLDMVLILILEKYNICLVKFL